MKIRRLNIINILTKKSRKGIILIKREEIKKKQQLLSVKITRLIKIDKFIKAYSKFTVGEEDAIKTEQRVFEAILYGFTSPFIWKIRDLHINF